MMRGSRVPTVLAVLLGVGAGPPPERNDRGAKLVEGRLVYGLEVNASHDYLVSAEALFVHNHSAVTKNVIALPLPVSDLRQRRVSPEEVASALDITKGEVTKLVNQLQERDVRSSNDLLWLNSLSDATSDKAYFLLAP